MHNIIAQIKYDNDLSDKIIHLSHDSKILDEVSKIVDTGVVDESLLSLHISDTAYNGGDTRGNTKEEDEC